MMNENYRIHKSHAEKFELLKAMHTIICMMNDEGAYMSWIYTIPDECDDAELMEIASDDDDEIFTEAVEKFGRLIRNYGDGGIYCQYSDKVYNLEEEE